MLTYAMFWCITRSNPNPYLVELDLELERTLRLIRNTRRMLFDTSLGVENLGVGTSNPVSNLVHLVFNPIGSSSFDFDSISSGILIDYENSNRSINMEDNRTLKELASPDINYQPLCV